MKFTIMYRQVIALSLRLSQHQHKGSVYKKRAWVELCDGITKIYVVLCLWLCAVKRLKDFNFIINMFVYLDFAEKVIKSKKKKVCRFYDPK